MNLFKLTRILGLALLGTAWIGACAKTDEKKAKNPVVASPTSVLPASASPVKLKCKVLFTRDNAFWHANLDGTGEQRLLPQIFQPDSGNQPLAINPDGTRVLYSHNPRAADVKADTTGDDLFDVRLDGTGTRRLTNTEYMLFSQTPRYSPDGKQIVYARFTGRRWGGPGYTDAEIRIMNADGSNDHRLIGDLTDLKHNHFNPHWSKDGKAILFTTTSENMDYSDYPEYKFIQRMISVNGRNERKFYDEWSRFASGINPKTQEKIASKVAGGARVNLIFSRRDDKGVVFGVSQPKSKKSTIWKSGNTGENAQKIVSNGQLVGLVP